jgi:hypothetical protein
MSGSPSGNVASPPVPRNGSAELSRRAHSVVLPDSRTRGPLRQGCHQSYPSQVGVAVTPHHRRPRPSSSRHAAPKVGHAKKLIRAVPGAATVLVALTLIIWAYLGSSGDARTSGLYSAARTPHLYSAARNSQLHSAARTARQHSAARNPHLHSAVGSGSVATHLGVPGHHNNVAYPIHVDGKLACASTYLVAVPMIEIKIALPVCSNLSHLRLPSGTLPPGTTIRTTAGIPSS